MAREERTEKATPKHRKRAREKGQVARSSDLGGAVVVTTGLLAIALLGPQIVNAGAASFREMLGEIPQSSRATSGAGLDQLMHSMLSTMELAVVPIAGACLAAGVIAGVAQVGFRPTAHALKPDFRRINPASGLKNLLGPNAVFEALKTILKVAVVGAVAALALLPGLTGLASVVGISALGLGALSGSKALEVAEHAAFAYILIGILDYAWKRRRHEQQLKMTKQQVKDETRQYGVSTEVKAAQRRRQMQAARARMMAAVPDADVVITNPTHFAVALVYDGTRTAPEVVAKGQDLIAAQIKRVAEESDVPVISDPPLARALHASVEIGQIIPQELYAAVARVLAFVYRLAGRKRMAGGGAGAAQAPRGRLAS
ncbi:MAG TPA: EscU/YscU/HrcU family type III secretion system export apparatus switch protein [Solirubrobacteraceae bacterium]|jgi:flagellar biosynthetic protein FlhB|nr:EscU/YscU/HrcU family type III secretion system export apparatus switch protein [Solirubrobacteraceae bacterium]